MEQNEITVQETPETGRTQIPPIYVANVFLMTKGKGKKARQTLVFLILRKKSVIPKAFTLRYRTVDETSQDGKGTMREFLYNKRFEDESCLIRFKLPKGTAITHCSAYISSYLTEEGKVELEPIYRSAKNGQLMNMLRTTATTDVSISAYEKPKRTSAHTEEQKSSFRRSALTIVSGVLLCAALIGGSIILYRVGERNTYEQTVVAAQVPYDAGLRVEAEELMDKYLSHNRLYKRDRAEMREIADELCEEGRYNEAYGMVKETMFASILQDVCTKAADAALADGDYETAYVYAKGAPTPFDDAVVLAAAADGYDSATRTISPSAGRVIEAAGDPDARDDLLLTAARTDMENGEHEAVTAIASMMSDGGREKLAALAEELGLAAVSSGDFDTARSYLVKYSLFGRLEKLASGLYHAYLTDGNYARAAELSGAYDYDFFTNTAVEAEDTRVRQMIKSVYAGLTDEQKRAYHAETFGASNTLTVVKDGTVTISVHGETKTIQNVVSAASGDFFTVLLHKDGTAELFSRLTTAPNELYTPAKDETQTMVLPGGGIVAVAAGEKHLVCLMADGTVQATGSNAYGQCDTAGWTDIVAVAAGNRFTVGLKSDGTVVSCGSNACGQCELSGYRNVVDVRACWQSTVLLFRNGEVKVVGEHSMGLADADKWTNVRRIRAGGTTVMAEKTDGSLLVCGSAAVDQTVLTDAVDFAVGDSWVVLRKSTGEIVTTGDTKPQT